MVLVTASVVGSTRAAPPAKPAESSAEQLTRAASLASTNFNAAIAVYDNILLRSRTSPEAQEALYRKGILLRALKRVKESEHAAATVVKDLLQQALTSWENVIGILGPSEWKDDALLELAGTHAFEMNKPDVALGFYNKLVQEYPRSERMAEARFQVAVIQFQKGEIANAKANFEKFLADFPDNADREQASAWLAKCAKAKSKTPGGAPQRQTEIWLG